MDSLFGLKTIVSKQRQLPVKESLLVIATTLIIAIFLIVYYFNSKVPVESKTLMHNSQQIVSASSSSLVWAGSQVAQVKEVDQIARNPFARLPEMQEKNNSTPISPYELTKISPQMLTNVSSKVPDIPHGKFKLMGIVSTMDEQLAVIRSDSSSQSYNLDEMVGAYKLVVITHESVILQNDHDELVLRLEVVGKKGDSKSGK